MFGSSAARRLTTQFAKPDEVEGIFRLILHSGSQPQHLGRIAFLDREDDEILLDPYAPEFDFSQIPHLPAEKALDRAADFVTNHSVFQRMSLSKIIDHDGAVVGFEVRPIYLLHAYGTEDVLDVSYRKKDNKVIISIHLNPQVERLLRT